MTLDELSEALGGRGRARLAWDCYSIGVDPALLHGPVIRLGPEEDYETVLSLLPTDRRSQSLGLNALERLAKTYQLRRDDDDNNSNANNITGVGQVEGGIATLSHVSVSKDRTTKMLLRLSDGLEVETVIIPWTGNRSTLCMSTQVGCRQACTFCATGRMGLVRSLTSDEILAQLYWAKKVCRVRGLPPVSNVVMMGMGESSDNAEAVNTALRIMTERQLFQLSAHKVTVSTVGPSPESFRAFSKSPCVLAWSVHAANDELRRKLVPTTKFTMKDLSQGLIDALLERPRHLRTTMLEVALIDGVNDSEREADELAVLANRISQSVPGCKLMLNIIPYNAVEGADRYSKPSRQSVIAFQKRLWQSGVYAHVRQTRGDDESAACGQLATNKRRGLVAQTGQVSP